VCEGGRGGGRYVLGSLRELVVPFFFWRWVWLGCGFGDGGDAIGDDCLIG